MSVMSCRVGACENVEKLSLLSARSVLLMIVSWLFIRLSFGGVSCLVKHAFVVDSLVACLNSRIHGRLGLPIWPDMPTTRTYPSSALCFDSCESECAKQDPKERSENGLDGRSISARRIRILQPSWSTLRCVFVVTSHNSCASGEEGVPGHESIWSGGVADSHLGVWKDCPEVCHAFSSRCIWHGRRGHLAQWTYDDEWMRCDVGPCGSLSLLGWYERLG